MLASPVTFKASLLELFSEVYTGPNHAHTWFIGNEPDSGLFGTLAGLSPEAASQAGPSGATVAAHAEHLRWSLAMANAFAKGAESYAPWSESWTVSTVDADAWRKLRADLQLEYETLLAAINAQDDFSDPQLLTGMLALVPHAAYHLGAIRQLALNVE